MSNDVILVPVTTVQPDLITQTDHIVYVPLASKTSHGIIKVGEGLNITQDGTLSFDRSEVTIKKVSLNGTEILPVDKNVNIAIDKTTVGLTNVDNTSDKDKPVSDATQEAIDELNSMLTDDILDVDDKIVNHMNDFENPHRVTKSQVGLDRVDNTSDVEKPISRATKNELVRIEGLIKGANGAVSYPNYEALIAEFNLLDRTTYPVGQSIYIETLNVPDLWIYAVEETSEPFEYTDDELIQSLLKYDGSFKVGFYRLAALETGKINLEDYVTLDTEQTISGDKNYVGELRYNGMSVATIDDINAVTLDSLSFQTTDGELIYANEKAYYQGQFTYTTKKSTTPISIDGTLVLPIKGDGVTISSDGNVLLIKAVIPEVDTSNLVTLDGIQNITGTKVFTEQIGILNGAEGEINYIKHINNNFLISASDGENIINIDEQLKTFNFYNKPIALEEYVDENFVSFTTQQMLTEEQKETVRNNIGAGTSSGPTIVVDSELSIDSENPVQNKVITEALNDRYTKSETYSQQEVDDLISDIGTGGSGGGSTIVDTDFSETSENPLQNKIITKAVKGQLLWENNNPSADFPAQIVTYIVENPDYDFIEIVFKYEAGLNWQKSMFVPKGTQGLLEFLNTPNILLARITGIVGGNSLKFEKAFFGQNGSESPFNNYVIPIRIIGYKRS